MTYSPIPIPARHAHFPFDRHARGGIFDPPAALPATPFSLALPLFYSP